MTRWMTLTILGLCLSGVARAEEVPEPVEPPYVPMTGEPIALEAALAAGDGPLAAVDGVATPVPTDARVPVARRLPQARAQRVVLPETRPLEAELAGPFDEASFQPAGYVEAAPEGLTAAPLWEEVPGGRVSALELSSASATALRLRLTGPFALGLEMYVYDPVGGFAFGPYRLDNYRDHEEYWTTIIFGEQIGLEFFLPHNEEMPAQNLPTINGVAYFSEVPGGVAGCTHRDVSCEAAWINTSNAVAMLATINQFGNVVGFCSGALINRSPADFVPLVLTANHCLGNQTSANNASYVWLFRTPSCNGTAPNPNNLPRSDGSLMLKRHTDTDWNLVGLYENQGGGFFLGWDANFWNNGSTAIGIHHPGGTFKRFSSGSKTGQQNQRFCAPGGVNCFDADVWNISFTTGWTQPGSSGSPIMDNSARVRGTLSGGPTDCTISRYGRFDLAFPNLRWYLFEMFNPSHVMSTVSGDSGNNGSSERGSILNPFNTVYEATFAVPTGGTVLIQPKASNAGYNERFTIRRAMVMHRLGSSGSAIIGRN